MNLLGANVAERRVMRLRVVSISLILVLVDCSSDPVVIGDAGGPIDGGTSPDAALTDAATDGEAGNATVAVYTNLTMAGYPHEIDAYVPSDAVRGLVFLHGGGGTKEGGATNELGVDMAWVASSRTAVILPQGQAVAGAPKATTWSNYVMTSGQDDVAFLSALASALRSGSFDARVPTQSRVYLAGHSNGGMMANRMWCELPAAFDAYGALAGPASIQLAPFAIESDGGIDPLAGAHACAPTVVRPYLGVVGDGDSIIQTKGNVEEDVWAVNTCLQQGDGGSFVDPRLVNERRMHDFRVTKFCAGAPSTPQTSGAVTSRSDCVGKIQLETVAGAEHCVAAGQLVCLDNKLVPSACSASLDATSGRRMRDVLIDFFASTE